MANSQPGGSGADDGDGFFASRALVLMADGRGRPIGEIKPGERIWTIADSAHLDRDWAYGTVAVVEDVERKEGSFPIFDVGGVPATGDRRWGCRAAGRRGFSRTLELSPTTELRIFDGAGGRFEIGPLVKTTEEEAPVVFALKTSARTFAVGPSQYGPFYLVHGDK